MKKYLRVTMPDGGKWCVPAEVIAGHRASYYANKHPNDSTYKDEFEFAMGDSGELMDWAANNMNWSDVDGQAIKEASAPVDYQEGWVNGDKEVVEK